MRLVSVIAAIALCFSGVEARSLSAPAVPEGPAATDAVDSDHDGLTDETEQALLIQFAPAFMISWQDCADAPALFTPGRSDPTVRPEEVAIYGQVTPRNFDSRQAVEIHYYHLWKSDCGRMSHPLDAEHVSVLAVKNTSSETQTEWRALYWYAAAHEDTMCDASQITRASALNAEDRGPVVWISVGKHASFLNERLCSHGCGDDVCQHMDPLGTTAILNLGESGTPMNGELWIASLQWPLSVKMARSDFQPAAISRLEQLPASDIAWVNPSKRPAQSTIAAGGSTADALAISSRKTDSALAGAGDSTEDALDTSYRNVTRALGKSAHNVGKFLHLDPSPAEAPKKPTEAPLQ
jgi:hypothetical protein